MDSHELAWAAGFFDGEGWSSCVNNTGKNPSLVIGVNQVCYRTLSRFADAVEIGNTFGPYQPGNPNAKPQYAWKATGYKAVVILDKLWPYLGETKREQATKAKAQWEARPNKRKPHKRDYPALGIN
jgi:hypothetical protein